MIQKLISEGRHVVAINFACAFELADKFPPVSLLEAYLKETKKDAQEICRRGNDPVKSQVCIIFSIHSLSCLGGFLSCILSQT